jgi:hypothetical protein
MIAFCFGNLTPAPGAPSRTLRPFIRLAKSSMRLSATDLYKLPGNGHDSLLFDEVNTSLANLPTALRANW